MSIWFIDLVSRTIKIQYCPARAQQIKVAQIKDKKFLGVLVNAVVIFVVILLEVLSYYIVYNFFCLTNNPDVMSKDYFKLLL